MRGKITSQGYTAEVESQPDGSFIMSLTNSSGHVMAAAQLAPDRPLNQPVRIAEAEPSWADRAAS